MTETKNLPLIAGNWKMHNNHFEAIALVQKLAFSLSDKDYKHVEVVVLPPFDTAGWRPETPRTWHRSPPRATTPRYSRRPQTETAWMWHPDGSTR